MRHGDFRILLKHAGHQAIATDIIYALQRQTERKSKVSTERWEKREREGEYEREHVKIHQNYTLFIHALLLFMLVLTYKDK